MEITLKIKSKLTEILMEGEATKRMIDDFNLSIQDLESLEMEELMAMNDNIIALQGAMDDIKRTLTEEINRLKEDSVEVKVSDLLDSYLNPREEKVKKVRIKEEKEVLVPDVIYQAVKLLKKHKIGIPYIEDGQIIEDIKKGILQADEAIMDIKRIYLEMIPLESLSEQDAAILMYASVREHLIECRKKEAK